jgi:hypothetical protein
VVAGDGISAQIKPSRKRPRVAPPEELVQNPTTALFVSVDHDTVTHYEFDVLSEDGRVVQTLLVPKIATSVQGGS